MTLPYYPYEAADPVSTTPTMVSSGQPPPQPIPNNSFSNLEGRPLVWDPTHAFREPQPGPTLESYHSRPPAQAYSRRPDHNSHYTYWDSPSHHMIHYQPTPHSDYLPYRELQPNQFRPHDRSAHCQFPLPNYPQPPNQFTELRRNEYSPPQLPPHDHSRPPNHVTAFRPTEYSTPPISPYDHSRSPHQYGEPRPNEHQFHDTHMLPHNHLHSQPSNQFTSQHQHPPDNHPQSPNQVGPQRHVPPQINNLGHSPQTLPVSQTPSRQDAHKTLDNTGYCILSLDGGGIRGLSTLYILQSIMWRLNKEREKSSLPPKKPCEIFDLIAGTSTGG